MDLSPGGSGANDQATRRHKKAPAEARAEGSKADPEHPSDHAVPLLLGKEGRKPLVQELGHCDLVEVNHADLAFGLEFIDVVGFDRTDQRRRALEKGRDAERVSHWLSKGAQQETRYAQIFFTLLTNRHKKAPAEARAEEGNAIRPPGRPAQWLGSCRVGDQQPDRRPAGLEC